MVTDLERRSLTTICPGSFSMLLSETASVEGVATGLVTAEVVATAVLSAADGAAVVEEGPGSDVVVAGAPACPLVLAGVASVDGAGVPSNTTSSGPEQAATTSTPTARTAEVAHFEVRLPVRGTLIK